MCLRRILQLSVCGFIIFFIAAGIISGSSTACAKNKPKHGFYISKIDKNLKNRINGKSYKANCTVPYSDLRYVHVMHIGFDGKTHDGEIICNKFIAADLKSIFKSLYKKKYPIEKICLVDDYNADDEASMEDNNSSSFNFRFISGTTKVSNHGLGIAIDINPLYNPYVKTSGGNLRVEPVNAGEYVDRTKEFPYKIDHNDLCYKLFKKHGFTWGGDWNSVKDYQHFEKKGD